MSQSKIVYVVYDQRANFGETDDAIVYDICESLGSARRTAKMHGGGAVYSYERHEDNSLRGESLVEVVEQ